MAEQMLFPETWEEFEKQYGIYDSKQAYVFGNTRLIPSFRVEQWLYHLDDIKRKEQSQKNKMSQVAALFGKRLGEEFTVKVPQYDEYGEVKQYQNVKGYFCGRGFRSEQINIADTFIFAELLEGYAVIINE